LLYARFFYKWFHDKGWVGGSDEPFERLFNQGMVLRHGEKMSKSRGNVVGIDETAERNGVDAMRLFLLKATPPEDTMEWTDEGIAGRVRFLDRVWRAAEPLASSARSVPLERLPPMESEGARDAVRALHAAFKSGAEETQTLRFHYNTTLARLDELVNALTKLAQAGNPEDPALLYAAHALPLALAPFAPHIADELWHRYGYATSVHLERWFEYDPAALAVDTIELVVQVNGKIRARITVAPGISESEALALAEADPHVMSHVGNKLILKRIFVPGKLVNLVV
jgi:leucyl-tRNA synthetase